MAVLIDQRFISGLSVYDTYNGLSGTITQMDLNSTATIALSPLYVGAYFVVQYTDLTTQLFTTKGKRVDHVTAVILTGVTLLTQSEYTALLNAGYPA